MVAVLVTPLVLLLELLVALVSLLELVVGLVVSLLQLVAYPATCFASFKIFSFVFLINISLPLHPASTNFGSLSFVTLCDVLSMFILRYKEKELRQTWIQFFEHPVFDSVREKLKRGIRQFEKPQEALEESLYTCFKCESNMIFSLVKQVRPADEGTTVFSKCPDCHNKWRDG